MRKVRPPSPDVVVGLVVVPVQDGGRQAEELHGFALGLVVIEGVELHGRLHQQLGLLVALHLAQRQQAAEQQLPPVLLRQHTGFTWNTSSNTVSVCGYWKV